MPPFSLTAPARKRNPSTNESDFSGELDLNIDWEKIGFESAADLAAENAVHAFDIRFKDFKEEGFEYVSIPVETARIEEGRLKFPMTSWNYRMIVLEKK